MYTYWRLSIWPSDHSRLLLPSSQRCTYDVGSPLPYFRFANVSSAAYIKGRNNFRNNHQDAHIGKYAFGFEWAAVACFLLATIFFCAGGGSRKDKGTSSGGKGFFKGRRSKSTRSQGSFIQNKEYS